MVHCQDANRLSVSSRSVFCVCTAEVSQKASNMSHHNDSSSQVAAGTKFLPAKIPLFSGHFLDVQDPEVSSKSHESVCEDESVVGFLQV